MDALETKNGQLTKLLLLAGVLAGPLFIAIYLVEGATRMNYDPVRYPVSSLSIGPDGWIQITNFLMTGFLFLLFSVGLRRTIEHTRAGGWGPFLMGLIGIGLIGAGIFSTDPVYGYPEDQPFLWGQQTLHGHLHNVVSMLVFIGIPAACGVFRRRFKALGERRWASYSLISGIGMPLFFILAALGFNQVSIFAGYGGAFQRLSTGIGFAWVTLLALYLLKTEAPK
jgi:hypothetical protein